MKKLFLIPLILCSGFIARAQWTVNGSNIYYYLGNVGIGTTSPDVMLAVNGNISVGGYGSASSNRSPVNSYTNLFLGGGIADQANGTYKVFTDGGSNYFAGIKMDNTGGNAEAIKFISGPSTGISSYTISNSNLDSYVRMAIVNGNVGIGTMTPDAMLAVSGQVHAQEVKVSPAVPGPDYVFEKEYKMPTLDSVKAYIEQNKHLPEIPSAEEMKRDGIQLGEMNMLLLKKIEELTLYIIEQENRIKKLEKNIDEKSHE